MLNHTTNADDNDIRLKFESFALPPSQFNHRTHIRMAYIYLCRHEPTVVHRKLRHLLRGFLTHHGLNAEKYHQTMTQAWVLAVHHFMTKNPVVDSAEQFIESNPKLLDSEILLSHYSRELLYSDTARKTFVEPDREPFPSCRSTNV